MESRAKLLFPEQEQNFRERTGKDFSFFYKKYYPKLIFYTARMCNDVQMAEDISTDSFMIAFEKIDKYEREKSQFSTWLFTIARNLMLQELKNNKKSVSLDIELDEEGTTMKDFLQEEESEEHIHELVQKKSDIIKKHISSLKQPYKNVIEMREINKMAYKDIADKLKLNLSTVKSQIRNGRAILEKLSEKEFSDLDEMYM
jgi:RNA polymerase sigma factor (sigma-70 family)